MKLKFTVIALAACIASVGFAEDTTEAKPERKGRPNAEGRKKGRDNKGPADGMAAGEGRTGGREGRPGGEGGPMPLVRIQAALRLEDLTPSQKTQLEALVQTVRPKAEALREEMKAAREKMQAGTPPDAETRKATREAMMTKGKALNEEVLTGLKTILSPEQIAKVQAAGAQPKNSETAPRPLPGNMPAMDSPTTSSATPQLPSAATAATTGTQEVAPFATAP